MTLALAIWGAVTGSAAIAFEAAKYLRDRPKLSLSLHIEMKRGALPEFGIDVRNQGRQPTTVMKAALRPDGETEIEKDGVLIATGKLALGLEDETPTVVMPGHVGQFYASLSKWPGLIYADEPLRSYVVDSNDHLIWGPAAPVLRVLLNGGWKPPVDTDPALLAALPGAPLRPEPVEPRWKVWTPRELRKPSLPPPQAWPRPTA